jgi:hypothetical protein
MVGMGMCSDNVIKHRCFFPVEIAYNIGIFRLFAAVNEHILTTAAYVNAVSLSNVYEMNSQLIVSRLVDISPDAVPYNKSYEYSKTEQNCNKSA